MTLVFSGLAQAISVSLTGSSIPFPYENCSSDSKEYTEQILSDESATQAGFCVTCVKRRSALSGLNFINSSYIPKQCFLAMAIKGNQIFEKGQYVNCENKTSSRSPDDRKVCVNEDYIDMIHTAFNRMTNCFGFDEKRQKEVFHLINQESRGILNARSKSGARCLGQITEDYVADINDHIARARKTEGKETIYAKIYSEVMNRCPDLENKIIADLNFLDCQSTGDPYKCLFYTFYGLEANHRRIKENLNSPANNIKLTAFSEEEKEMFKLPLKLKEMLIAKGTIIESDGRVKEVDLTFWDESELYATLNKLRKNGKKIQTISTKKVPLFKDEEDIEILFNYWSHNGGLSLSGGRMQTLVESLKQSITRSCPPAPYPKKYKSRCTMREKIKRGEALSTKESWKFFELNLRYGYPGKVSRKREVAYYVDHIIKTNNHIFGFEKGSKGTNDMIESYEDASPLSEAEALQFQSKVSSDCPKADFIEN